MLKPLRQTYQFNGPRLQQTVTWLLLGFIVITIVSRLLQQAPSTILGVGILVGFCLLVGVIAWQHWQIRRLHNRVHHVEKLAVETKPVQPVKPIAPAPESVTHIETEHLFYQGQTKH
jgi:hypothetical protein